MKSSRRGNGIGNMQRRINELHGRLIMHSAIWQGFTAEIHLPLPARRSAHVGI